MTDQGELGRSLRAYIAEGSDALADRVIEAALDRIENGSYGTCARCGDPIGEDRLDVVPATPLCRDCAAAS